MRITKNNVYWKLPLDELKFIKFSSQTWFITSGFIKRFQAYYHEWLTVVYTIFNSNKWGERHTDTWLTTLRVRFWFTKEYQRLHAIEIRHHLHNFFMKKNRQRELDLEIYWWQQYDPDSLQNCIRVWRYSSLFFVMISDIWYHY